MGPAFPLLWPFPVINVRYKLRQQPILPTVKFSIWAAAHKPNALRHRGREAASARDIFLFKDIFFFNDIFVFKDISFCKNILHLGYFLFNRFSTACIFDFKEILFSKDILTNRLLKGIPCQSKGEISKQRVHKKRRFWRFINIDLNNSGLKNILNSVFLPMKQNNQKIVIVH